MEFPDVEWIKRWRTEETEMGENWTDLTMSERGLFASACKAIFLYGSVKDDWRSVCQHIKARPDDIRTVRKAWPKVRELLSPTEDGRLTNLELMQALAASDKRMKESREHGKMGGRPKKQNGENGNRPVSETETARLTELELESESRADVLTSFEHRDLDYQPRIAKNRDAMAGPGRFDDEAKLSALVTEMLGGQPSADAISRIVAATPSGTAAEALQALRDARPRARGHHAPGTIKWFICAVENYFRERGQRALPAMVEDDGKLDRADFDRMTGTFDS